MSTRVCFRIAWRTGPRTGNGTDNSAAMSPPVTCPRLKITRKPASIFDYTLEDFEVVGYKHHPTIKAPIAV